MRKRKTKQEKIIADLRKKMQENTLPVQKASETYVLPQTSTIIHSTKPLHYADAETQAILVKDLRKTFLLTILIIAAECILYFLLMKRIVSLPMQF